MNDSKKKTLLKPTDMLSFVKFYVNFRFVNGFVKKNEFAFLRSSFAISSITINKN